MTGRRAGNMLLLAAVFALAVDSAALLASAQGIGFPVVGTWIWNTMLAPFDPSHVFGDSQMPFNRGDYIIALLLPMSYVSLCVALARLATGTPRKLGKAGLVALAAWGVVAALTIWSVLKQGYEHFASVGWGMTIFIDPASWLVFAFSLVLAVVALFSALTTLRADKAASV
jgi:hypothetical protein